MKLTQQKWRNMSGKVFDEPITKLVKDAIVREQKAGNRLKICVGSDSQAYQDYIAYATVVVVISEGKGGFMFIKNLKGNPNIRLKKS